MYWGLNEFGLALGGADSSGWLGTTVSTVKVIIGFSLIIFVHELGHFLAAKWAGVRVDRFAIGFFNRVCGWRRGEGFTLGTRPDYSAEELRQKGWGETDYCLKILPFGGYVKMLGQDDIQVNEETGEVKMSDDPRAFTNRPVGQRMIVVSAGVIFNLLFAFFAFAGVYMLGKRELAPQIGTVIPAGPAARAGVRAGDVVLAANGSPVESYRDIVIALILADDGVVRLKVQRNGAPLPEELVLRVDPAGRDPVKASGMRWYDTTQVTELLDARPGADHSALQVGDRITRVGEEAVQSATDFELAIGRHVARTGNPRVPLTVERPDPNHPGATTTLTCDYEAALLVGPADPRAANDEIVDSQHILGLLPRRRVVLAEPGSPGARAGLKPGDVIAQWHSVANPRYGEIVRSIHSSPGQPIPIVVDRNGQLVHLTVTPKRPFRLWGTADARVGVVFLRGEERLPIVADVVAGTPAANLNLPRGARLLSIDGQPVSNWFDVVRVLRESAGKTVSVRYRSGELAAEGRLTVPSSAVNELHLPLEAVIVAVNDETGVILESGVAVRLPEVAAVQGLLKKHAGQTVRVKYQLAFDDPTLREADFAVQPDLSNADPWQLRINCGPAFDVGFAPKESPVKTSNVLTAAYLGVRHTGLVLLEVYRVVRTIVGDLLTARGGTVQHISGPVGIVGEAVGRAKQGFAELLFFMAFLSVNLAVLNFLPFPVVDGGLMVFLILEKLRGKALSFKMQMWATVVGLATIVLIFLLVTIQDISRFFST